MEKAEAGIQGYTATSYAKDDREIEIEIEIELTEIRTETEIEKEMA